VYSSVILGFAWPAICDVSMLLPPTSCLQVMFARRSEWAEAGEIASLGCGRQFQCLPDTGIPHRLLGIIGLWEDPSVWMAFLQVGNPNAIAIDQ
jgi:hypothetical protein